MNLKFNWVYSVQNNKVLYVPSRYFSRKNVWTIQTFITKNELKFDYKICFQCNRQIFKVVLFALLLAL